MPVVDDRPELDVNAVVYATDFSIYSEKAGQYALLLAKQFSATLLVTHAFLLTQAAMEVELGNRTASRQREELQALLTHKASAFDSGSVKAVPVLLDGNPHEVIPALAEKHAPSMIVLGTHGAGRIEHGLIGSVAEKILRSVRWPCLTVGPHAPAAVDGALPFRRILYATDLTAAAAHAAVFALAFAEASGGTIDVLNVVSESTLADPARSAELQSRYYHALDQLIPQQAREFCNPRTFVKTGNAHDRIMGHIRENEIDLLVLGIRKTSHLSLEMRTSGAFRLIADAPCPVLTITG